MDMMQQFDRCADAVERLARLAERAEREADRVAQLIAADRVARPARKSKAGRKARAAPRVEIVAPTPEAAAQAPYVLQPVHTEQGQLLGRAWRRQPWFESLAKREAGEAERAGRVPLIGGDELAALRFYRNAFEMAERSAMKSSLDILPGGAGPGQARDLPPAVLTARADVALCESLMGEWRPTMRAVAIEDRTYAAVAMARFGSRNQDWYDGARGAFVAKPVPRSNRHPQIIRAEFLAGLQALAEAVRGRVRTG
ncbi:hypothetical protein SAMN05444678_103266 [Sphingomonas sp. YR710]|jgi:hypothetical protein|nr:hypothetical protein SAMN05444678_103266 [Sphingomonas sp. YR710]